MFEPALYKKSIRVRKAKFVPVFELPHKADDKMGAGKRDKVCFLLDFWVSDHRHVFGRHDLYQ